MLQQQTIGWMWMEIMYTITFFKKLRCRRVQPIPGQKAIVLFSTLPSVVTT
jgi:hypothetical protein